MQTRRDQLHAYRFVVRRASYAVLHGDPDTPETPLRRLTLATVGGITVLGLLAAGFAVIGLIRPGGAQVWRQPGALVVEKETGTRYVFVDGALHPVLNYASARLVLGTAGTTTKLVSRASLAGVPRGLPVGIPGAPDTLPDARALVTTPWVGCAGQATDAGGNSRPSVALYVGLRPVGPPLGAGQAALVRTADQTQYLVWGGRRLRLADASVPGALGYAGHEVTPVGDAWVSALPAGPDLAPPTVPGRGRPGPALGGHGTLVGQVVLVHSPGTSDSYYLVRGDGLSPLAATDAALILGDPRTRVAYPGQPPAPVVAGAADVAAAARAATPSATPGYPPVPPSLVDPAGRSLCASFADPSTLDVPPTVNLAAPAAGTAAAAGAGSGAPDGALADQVGLPPGGGALVRAVPAPGVNTGTIYLITDLGVKYPIPSADLISQLGFGNVTPAPVSWTLLQLIPTGAPLDPTAARRYQQPATH